MLGSAKKSRILARGGLEEESEEGRRDVELGSRASTTLSKTREQKGKPKLEFFVRDGE